MNKKNSAKTKIMEYMMHTGETSKVELAKELNLSMPTVLSNVNELIDRGLVVEVGEGQSTGGRKAKLLSLKKDYCYAVGINITANHISKVLINLSKEVVKQERHRVKFSTDISYFTNLAQETEEFLKGIVDITQVIGIGIALPGIIDKEKGILMKSHALGLERYSLGILEQVMPLPVYFENDANAAMRAENFEKDGNVIYLSLSNTVGGAIQYNGKLFEGQNQKAGEFGHMILVPNGRTCYCGKKGCADAYCSAKVLIKDSNDSLETFFKELKAKNPKAETIWETYLDYLAILISNLRMAYDTDIILGGDVGGRLQEYMLELGEKVLQYNLFEQDLNYLKTCTYHQEASAVGAAKYFFDELIRKIK